MSNTEGVPEDERAVVEDRPGDYDQQVKDAQTAALDEEREEHNRRARESAGQDEAISDEVASRQGATTATSTTTTEPESPPEVPPSEPAQ